MTFKTKESNLECNSCDGINPLADLDEPGSSWAHCHF